METNGKPVECTVYSGHNHGHGKINGNQKKPQTNINIAIVSQTRMKCSNVFKRSKDMFTVY